MIRSHGPAWAGSVPGWTAQGRNARCAGLSRRQASVAAEACTRRQSRKGNGQEGDMGVVSGEQPQPCQSHRRPGRMGEGNTSSATRRPWAHCPGSRAPGQSPAHTPLIRSSLVLSGPVTISVSDPWAGISASDPWAGLSAPHSSLVYTLWICPLGDALGKNSDRLWLNWGHGPLCHPLMPRWGGLPSREEGPSALRLFQGPALKPEARASWSVSPRRRVRSFARLWGSTQLFNNLWKMTPESKQEAGHACFKAQGQMLWILPNLVTPGKNCFSCIPRPSGSASASRRKLQHQIRSFLGIKGTLSLANRT